MTNLANRVNDFEACVILDKTKVQEQGSSHYHRGCSQ